MVKEFLSTRGVPYHEHDVSRDPAAAQEMIQRTGQRGVPVTIINGDKLVIGFDRPALEEALRPVQQRQLFGAAVADANRITTSRGNDIILGAYVGRVKEGSAAYRLGLQPGDIITEINHQAVTSADSLEKLLLNLQPGNKVIAVLLRNGQQLSAEGTY